MSAPAWRHRSSYEMLPAIPDGSKKSRLRVKRNPIGSETSSAETSRNHISAISAVIASVGRLIHKPKRTSNIQHQVTSTTLAPSPSLTVDSDTINTLERHNAAIEKLKSSLTDRRNDWRSFEFSGLHTWSEHGDSSNLRHEIDKVLNAKRQSIGNTTAISKSKVVIECVYQALSPFLKNFLTVGRNMQSVYSRGVIVCWYHVDSYSQPLWLIMPGPYTFDYGRNWNSLVSIEKIADCEIARRRDVEKALEFIHRQLQQLEVINELPDSEVRPTALINRAMDVESAVLTFITVHIRHEGNRLGLIGSSLSSVVYDRKHWVNTV